MNHISYGLMDKVVLVTGGSRGIGLEIARRLIDEGATVIICGRKQEGLDLAVQELNNTEQLLAIACHTAKEDQVTGMMEQISASFGRLDVLINNVGMNLMTASTLETEISLWNKIIDSNLNATFLCAQKAAGLMKAQKAGKIVSITSIAGRRAAPGMGIYGVAKSGIEMLTKVLASELAGSNIQVNAVAPGMVRTDFSKPFWSNEQFYSEIVKGIPMGRIAEAIDVVHPTLFFASSAADFITGQTLVVDGGATAI